MEQSLSSLHPNPGWATTERTKDHLSSGATNNCSLKSSATDTSATDMVGKHCILELYDCDPSKLDDETFLRHTITTAAQRAGATLLNLITHRFEPQGVTGLALLAESHISIHTWPENGYAAVDVFTCGDHTMPEKACEVLCEELGAGRHALRSFLRETPAALGKAERIPAIPLAA
jgi:S-adenosylmethionine decarboxylase